MKKQSLLTLLSITAISISLICTPFNIYANIIDMKQYNTSLIASAQITIKPVIVIKGKTVICDKKLDRDMALKYLNKDKTSLDFNDITIMVNVKGKSAELINGAMLDLTKHNGEEISLDYIYNNKVLKTLNLKVKCVERILEFNDKFTNDMVILPLGSGTLDVFKYIDVEAAGGIDNIIVKITKEAITTVPSAKNTIQTLPPPTPTTSPPIKVDKILLSKPGKYTITYSLKNNPKITKELVVIVKNTPPID